MNIFLLIISKVINNYCDASNLPVLPNATAITPVNATILATNYFTCNNGLLSSGGSIFPYYGCNAKNTTNGIWSTVTNYCICTVILYYLNATNIQRTRTVNNVLSSFTCIYFIYSYVYLPVQYYISRDVVL